VVVALQQQLQHAEVGWVVTARAAAAATFPRECKHCVNTQW
jgi:hypothetical protein